MNWSPPVIPALATSLESEIRRHIDGKTKPPGSLGRLESLALQLGLIQETVSPELRSPTLLVFAGDHGLAVEGVSAYPQSVTAQMVTNFLNGGAAINVFARQNRLALKVVDAGVAADLPEHPNLIAAKVRHGTRNSRWENALAESEVMLCLERGVAVVETLRDCGANALLLGEMGIGNTSAASLIFSTLLALPLSECVGRGTGLDDEGLSRKREVLEAVQKRHSVASDQPLRALAAFGGCEIAMMSATILAGAAARMAIVIDGFITTAAVVVAAKLQPAVLDYCIFAHGSAEAGHCRVLTELGVEPLLDLELRLGEGTGAALAWPIITAAVGFMREMATFSSAGVSQHITESDRVPR